MGITALEIQNEGFEHGLRGYDVKQVDVFLERVAKEVDAMNAEIEDLKSQLQEANEQLASAQADAARAVEPEQAAAGEADARSEQLQADLELARKRLAEADKKADEARREAAEAAKRADAAEAEIAPLKEQLEEKSKLDSAISAAFISAQRSADQMLEEARAEGDRIYRESEAKAREFIREALAKKASVFNEIESLQKSSDDFREQYIAMVEKFANEARDKFAQVTPPAIPDGIVNDLLPDIESIAVPVADESGPDAPKDADDDAGMAMQAGSPASSAPRLTTEALPVIGKVEDED